MSLYNNPPSKLPAAFTPITTYPTPAMIKNLCSEVYAAAIAVPSICGGGQFGHLGSVMDAPTYLATAGVAYVSVVYPGVDPDHSNDTTQVEYNETNRRFKARVKEHATAAKTEKDIKDLLMAAIHDRYVFALKHPELGYATVSIARILAHLKAEYAIVEPAELEANRDHLKIAINIDDDLKNVWNCITECTNFAQSNGAPLTNKTIVFLMLEQFCATGVFTIACGEWEKKPATERTPKNFKPFFNKADKLRRKNLKTAKAGGFHGANHTAPAALTNTAAAQLPAGNAASTLR